MTFKPGEIYSVSRDLNRYLDHKDVLKLKKGDKVSIMGNSSVDSWLKVCALSNGVPGHFPKSYLQIKNNLWNSKSISYTSTGNSLVLIPAEINPYKIFGLSEENLTYGLVKKKFYELIASEERVQRAKVSLAYAILSDVLSGQSSDYFRLKSPTSKLYEYDSTNAIVQVLTGQCEALMNQAKKVPSILKTSEPSGYSLLYIASRSGYLDLVSYLIQSGINENQSECKGGRKTTSMHAAAYYGHYPVVSVLIARGASVLAKNYCDCTPLDEGRTTQIKELLSSSNELTLFLQSIQSQSFMSKLEIITHQSHREVVGYKISRNVSNRKECTKNWKRSWHGTKKKNVISILKNGLRIPGEIVDGAMIEIPDNHYGEGVEIDGVRNWSAAVFVSPEISYASHPCYAGRISTPGHGEYCILLEVSVRPGKFTTHKSTVAAYSKKKKKPVNEKNSDFDGYDWLHHGDDDDDDDDDDEDDDDGPEMRVEPGSVESTWNSAADATIIRVNATANVVVLALTLLSVDFIENTKLSDLELRRLVVGKDICASE